MLHRTAQTLRRAMLSIAVNEALYLFVAFITFSFLAMDPLKWYQESVTQFRLLVVLPWGGALCLAQLYRRMRIDAERADLCVLFLLLAWITVPFIYRFGFNFNTSYSFFNHAVVFFGLYAMTTLEDEKRRTALLDGACALFALLSAVLGAVMLYCIVTGAALGADIGEHPFGFNIYGNLTFGIHYNLTGMAALCCALLCLTGAARRRHPLARAAYLLPSLLMVLAVVLTQSRTSRYALLLALCVGVYGYASRALPIPRPAARHAAAAAIGLAVIVAGYLAAQAVTAVALNHLNTLRRGPVEEAGEETGETGEFGESGELDEFGESGEPEATPEPEDLPPEAVARESTDSSFSERTILWGNLIELWREQPKYFFIGNGVGRTGSRIVHGTTNEPLGAIAVHNTYLQFIADYGLIGFGLMLIFLGMMATAALRVFFVPAARLRPEDIPLVMTAVSLLLVGLMESQPLGAMQPANLTLFFVLAMLYGRSRDIRAR